METPRKECSNDDSFDKNKTASEYGNSPERMNSDNSGNESFENTKDEAHDDGRRALIDKYNINDQAHSDSSADDFIKTTSGFTHADDVNPDNNENPDDVSNAD